MPGASDRPGHSYAPGQPAGPDAPRRLQPADLAADNQSPRWSRDDLRQRLERLPPGHPSSLAGDGRGRPDHGGGEAQADHRADAVKRDFWTEVPRFRRAWAEHAIRWPAERVTAAIDRSRDPAGSWRGDGNQYLDPEQHHQARNVIDLVRGREEKITEDIRAVERENIGGGWLEGLDHRLKGDERVKEKIAEKVEHEPGKTVATAARQVSDAIRYTFCFDPTSYSDGYRDVARRLEVREYRMIYSKNHWADDPEYKGINTRWVTPEGQRFELQFHTAESFHAKEDVTHGPYERLRNALTSDEERRELRSYQREVCSWIAVPEGVEAISDQLLKGHG